MNWISVKDRLPEIDEWVILTNGKAVKMGTFTGEYNIDENDLVYPDFNMCSCCYDACGVTHWAELKDLPQ